MTKSFPRPGEGRTTLVHCRQCCIMLLAALWERSRCPLVVSRSQAVNGSWGTCLRNPTPHSFFAICSWYVSGHSHVSVYPGDDMVPHLVIICRITFCILDCLSVLLIGRVIAWPYKDSDSFMLGTAYTLLCDERLLQNLRVNCRSLLCSCLLGSLRFNSVE